MFYVFGGNLALEEITVADGSAPADYGGGVYKQEGTLSVRDSTFSGNSSVGVSGQGGAIYGQGGALTVTGSTFSGNSSNVGGAITAVRSAASATNSTFYNNSSVNNGGAIRSFTGGGRSFAVSYSTFFENGSDVFAGAISGDATLSNTLLANNTALKDGNCSQVTGLPADGGYNISDDDTCGFTASTSENETDPLLDTAGLQDNGGPTETVALQETSPALDLIPTGQNGCGTTVITDQRGLVRPADGPDEDSTRACDSGAYEANAVEPVRGSLSFSAAAYTVNEGAGTATITVNRTGGTDGEVSVNYATSTGGTATAGQDYTAASGTLTFANGDSSESFTVPITNDATDEPDESVNLTLSNPTGGATLGTQSTATLNITDDAAAPSLSITDETVTEGDAGTTEDTFTVTLSAASGRTVSVGYATQDDSANAPGDYGATSGTLTFAPGDTLDEPDERFFVSLSDPANASVADGRGTGTIQDDDALPSLSISDGRVTEGDDGTKDASFVVGLSSASAKTASVEYATQDGSASAPSDFQSRSGTLTFAPGQTQKTVSVPVRGDTAFEADEIFFVELSEPTNATISDRAGRATIVNDDVSNECTIVGTGASESLIGTANRDVICALGGDDTVLALGGNDVVRAGQGDDLISGGNGEDSLVGGEGEDLLSGQGGDDDLDAKDGSGGDTIDGGPGTDTCRSDRGDDVKGCP